MQHLADPRAINETILGHEIQPCIAEMAETLGVEPTELGFVLLYEPTTVFVRNKEDDPTTEKTWIPGHIWTAENDELGPRPADLMIVGKHPGKEENYRKRLWVGETSRQFFTEYQKEAGVDFSDAYVTNVLKFSSGASSGWRKWEEKICLWFLLHEIKIVQPEFILVLGTTASQVLMGEKITRARSKVMEKTFPFEDNPHTCTLFATKHPAGISRTPALKRGFVRDLQTFDALQQGKTLDDPVDHNYRYLDTPEKLRQLVDVLIEHNEQLFSIDTEWGIEDGKEILRSVQFAWAPGEAAYIALRDEQLETVVPTNIAGKELRRLICREGVKVEGQNLRSDEPIFKREFDFSLVDRLACDLMILDHMIDENRPHDLTSIVLRYTEMGRYDIKLNNWLDENNVDPKNVGYGPVPTEILFPYGCSDADGCYRAIQIADQELKEPARGLFYDLVIPSQIALAEAEETGYKVDVEKVLWFTDFFNQHDARMEKELQKLANDLGWVDARDKYDEFNPRSNPNAYNWGQVGDLLFRYLGVDPIYSTDSSGGLPWDEIEDPEEIDAKPSTDASTLMELQKYNPDRDVTPRPAHELSTQEKKEFAGLIASKLLNYRTINTQTTKLFKQYEMDDDGNIVPAPKSFLSLVREDERIHPRIKDILDTGRRSTSEPNSQNLSHRKMADVRRICGDDTPHIRTVITAPEEYVLVGADYESAELFTMAFLAEDDHLYEVLSDPNRDLHGEQAIRMYDLPYDSECGVNPKAWCKENGYGHYRDHAKGVDFGWSYQIGPSGLHKNMRKNGVECTEADCEEWLELLSNEFPKTQEYFQQQMQRLYDPGYVENPWGRIRHLYVTDIEYVNREQQRKAANFPIQSTVGDLIRAAMLVFQHYRDKYKLDAHLCPDLHDAIYVYVRGSQLRPLLEEVFPRCLELEVPKVNMVLDWEEDVYVYMEEKPSVDVLLRRGVEPDLAQKYGKKKAG